MMMLRLILLIVWILSGSFYASAKHYSFHWIFVHYHKTGHDLARSLAMIFTKKSCVVKESHQIPRRISISENIHRIKELDIAVLAGPNIFVPWDDTLLNTDTDRVKMIHFLRDPFDMIISAYLYHAQEEAPKKEIWLFRPNFNPCEVDHHLMFDVFAREIGVSYGSYQYISDLINGTIRLCNELVHITDKNNIPKYYQQLRSLPPEKAVLLEASRSILSNTGGDILRMATNALYERNTKNRNSYRVFLSDFPVGNLTKFVQSSTNMFEFLMSDTTTAAATTDKSDPYFWSCLNISTAVHRSVQHAFVSNSSQSSSTGHITQGLVSRTERASLKLKLEEHPILGKLLRIVQDIVLEYRN